jgi:hypothetical protein
MGAVHHLLRKIDRVLDLRGLHRQLLRSTAILAALGRSRADRRMPLVGYCYGIRSERRVCEEVHLNLHTDGSADWGSSFSTASLICATEGSLAQRCRPPSVEGQFLVRISTVRRCSCRGRLWVTGGCRRQANAAAGLPPAPEIPRTPRQLRLVPHPDLHSQRGCKGQKA